MSLRISIHALTLAIVIAAFLAVGCGPSQTTQAPASKETAPAPKAASSAPKESTTSSAPAASKPAAAPARGNLTVAFKSDMVKIDPHDNTDMTTRQVTDQIFEKLVILGRDMKYEPVLAESWEVVDDTTWRFKLRKGVKFTNGEEFTAEAVKFSMDRLADTKENLAAGSTYRPNLAETVVVDPYTVLIKTRAPYPDLITILNSGGHIIPPKYFKEVGKEKFIQNPVGTGPYKLASWKKDVEVVLEANDDYWRGKPAFAKFIFRPIPEDSARIAALLKGEIDIAAGLSMERVKEIEAKQDLSVAYRAGQQIYLGMDTLKLAPFKDKRVRQAMNYAIDVNTIVKDVLAGQGTRLNTMMFPTMLGYDASLKPYPYDPEKAKALLAEAGFANGFDVVITVPMNYQGAIKLKEVGEVTANYLSKVGVRARIELMETAAAEEKYRAKQFQMYFYGWSSDILSSRIFDVLLHSKNRGYYYQDPEADKLIDAYKSLMDPKKRAEVGKQLQKFFYDDAPFVYLYQEREIYGLSKKIDWQPHPADIVMHSWEVKAR